MQLVVKSFCESMTSKSRDENGFSSAQWPCANVLMPQDNPFRQPWRHDFQIHMGPTALQAVGPISLGSWEADNAFYYLVYTACN